MISTIVGNAVPVAVRGCDVPQFCCASLHAILTDNVNDPVIKIEEMLLALTDQFEIKTFGRRRQTDQCPPNTSVLVGSSRACIRRIIACTSAMVSTTCNPVRVRKLRSSPLIKRSWLLV